MSKASIAVGSAVAVVVLCFLLFPGLFLFALIDAGANGELASGQECGSDLGPSSPESKWVWVATDVDAFRILQNLRHGSITEIQAAGRRMSGRILPLGDGTHIRLKAYSYFDGTKFLPDNPQSAERERGQRVLKVKVKSGYAEGQAVLVPGSCVGFRTSFECRRAGPEACPTATLP
jgi:hypothetical protein